jgi:hypothetical protein
MVSWAEEFPQLVSQQHKLLRKINKMREEWDKLWDLLPPLRYPNRSLWGWEDTTCFQFPGSKSMAELRKARQEEHRRQLQQVSLLPNPILQGLTPSSYQFPDMWRPEKCKTSYPAQGVKRQRSHQD